MLNIVLFEPEIHRIPGTSSAYALTPASPAYIEPMGFTWDDKRLRRAGLDYHEFAAVKRHHDYAAFVEAEKPERLFAHHQRNASAQRGELSGRRFLMFGPETRGLPMSILDALPPDKNPYSDDAGQPQHEPV
jgi:tRNA (cytidine/uridine-2'-O-)-methyltransferase